MALGDRPSAQSPQKALVRKLVKDFYGCFMANCVWPRSEWAPRARARNNREFWTRHFSVCKLITSAQHPREMRCIANTRLAEEARFREVESLIWGHTA